MKRWQLWAVILVAAMLALSGCGEGNVAHINSESGQGTGTGGDEDFDGDGDGTTNGESCRVTSILDNGDGTYTVTCSGVPAVVVADSDSGGSCEITDHGDGSYTISCGSGTVLVPSDQSGGDCTVTDNEDGTHTISCEDGSEVIVVGVDPDGDGDGDGDAGCEVTSVTNNGDGTYTVICSGDEIVVVADTDNGGNCEVVDHGDGSFTMNCGTGSVLLPDDQSGGDCTVVENPNGTHTISCDDGSEVVVTGVDPNGGGDGDGLPDTGDKDGSDGCIITDLEGHPDDSQAVICGDLGPIGTIGTGTNGDGVHCTVTENADGTVTVTCDDGSTVTLPGGSDGGVECTIYDNFDGTYTISCDDGSEVTVIEGGTGDDSGTGCPIDDVSDNGDGSYTLECEGLDVIVEDSDECTITDNGNGTYTITCDGTSVTVPDGTNGDCTLVDNGNGTFTISCDDGTVIVIPGTGVDPDEEITPIGEDGDPDPGYGGIPNDASTGKFCAEPMSMEGTYCGGSLGPLFWDYGGKWIGHSACVDHDFRILFDEPSCEPSYFTEFDIAYEGESVFRNRWWWWWSWNANYRARLEAQLDISATVEVPDSCTSNFGGCGNFEMVLGELYAGVDVSCSSAADGCECTINGTASTFTGGYWWRTRQQYGGLEVNTWTGKHRYGYCTNWSNRTMDLIRVPPEDGNLDTLVFSQRLRWIPFSQCQEDNHCHQNWWFFGGTHYCNNIEQCVPYCESDDDCFENEVCNEDDKCELE